MSERVQITVKFNGIVAFEFDGEGLRPKFEMQNELEDITSEADGGFKKYRIAAKHIRIDWDVPLRERELAATDGSQGPDTHE